jgi:hypothetical protein
MSEKTLARPARAPMSLYYAGFAPLTMACIASSRWQCVTADAQMA